MIAPGTRIGPYEVVAAIGAGGMGEVYRARDTKLDRDVAIKILPAAFASDAERLARFEREAKTLASLNHPGIAQVFGLEVAQGFSPAMHALVMEFVAGENLAQRIIRGAVPVDEALAIAKQIAAALEAAHDKGIVHRDLKPANVMLTSDGDVKVLDFGLAKAGEPVGRDASHTGDFMNSPTITSPATQLGTILGTAAYMSPEQAKGRPADRRSDVWALGCVLFEMLTARRAFEGEDMSDTLAAVLRGDPDWSALPPATPPHVKSVIEQCLARDRKLRIPDVSVVRYMLDGGSMTGALRAAGVPAPSRSPLMKRAMPIAAAAVAGAAIVAAIGWPMLDRAAAPRLQFSIDNVQIPRAGTMPALALSPDGRYLAHAGSPDASSSNVIFVRTLADGATRVVAGTEGAGFVFWSPDSRFIGFLARGTIRKVPVAGGPPQDIATAIGNAASAAWGNGEILFSAGALAGARLYRVPDGGGTPIEVLKPDGTNYTALRAPLMLPGGRRFLYLGWSADPASRAIMTASLDGGAPSLVVHADTQPAFAAPGFLLYGREGTLFVQRFDAKQGRVLGELEQVAESVRYSPLVGRAAFTASDTGLLAFFRGGAYDTARSLVWLDRAGKPIGTAADPAGYDQLRLSPDGRRVALAMPDLRTTTMSLSVLELASKITTPLAVPGGGNDPVWMPGGEQLMFEKVVDGKRDFYAMPVGGRDTALQFASAEEPKWLNDLSRDGRYVLYHRPQPSKLFVVEMSGPAEQRKARLLFEHDGSIDGAHFSPDGKWIAYMSDQTGEFEVWLAAFPAFDRRRKISAGGGGQPMWRGDGRELFYLTPDGTMMSTKLTYGADGVVDIAAPVALFKSPIQTPNLTIDQYGVTADGQRFLMIQPGRQAETVRPAIHVIVNWLQGITLQ